MLAVVDRAKRTVLRPYQDEAIALTLEEWRGGARSVLCVMPTGAGKTVIAASLGKMGHQYGRRVMFLVTRETLVSQTREKFVALGIPEADIGIVQGSNGENRRAPLQIASLQTLGKRQWWKTGLDPHLLIFDEAHESRGFKVADTVCNTFPDAKVLGLTATPYLLDNRRSLADEFDRLVSTVTPRDLQAQGYLCEAKYYAARPANLADIAVTRSGEFNERSLQQRCNHPYLFADILEQRDRLAAGRPTLAFCAGIEHAVNFAAFANDRGVATEVVTGSTSNTVRHEIYARLRSGKTQIVANVGVLTTGFDEPCVSCLLLMRPTQSRALHEQIIGRGLRIAPGKEDCIIIDQARNCPTHSVPESILGYTLGGDGAVRSADDGRVCCPVCQHWSANTKVCDGCGFELAVGDDAIDLTETLADAMGDDRYDVPRFFGFERLKVETETAAIARQIYQNFRWVALRKGHLLASVRYRYNEWAEANEITVSPKREWAADCFEPLGDTPWDRLAVVQNLLERIARKKKKTPAFVRAELELEFQNHPDILSHIRESIT